MCTLPHTHSHTDTCLCMKEYAEGVRAVWAVRKEEDEEEDEEEYLQTANWQLGNRRVKCTLMSRTGQRKKGGALQHHKEGEARTLSNRKVNRKESEKGN